MNKRYYLAMIQSMAGLLTILVFPLHGSDSLDRQLPVDELTSSLELATAAVSANLEKLRTWNGAYKMELSHDVKQGFKKQPSDPTVVPPSPDVYRAVQGSFRATTLISGRFELDRSTNSLYSTYIDSGEAVYVNKAGGDVERFKVDAGMRQSILADNEFLHSDANSSVPEVEGVYLASKTNPRGSKTITRDSRQLGESQTRYSIVFDPRQLLGHGNLSFDKMLENFLQLAKSGKTTVSGSAIPSASNPIFRFTNQFRNGLTLMCEVDGGHGFNVTHYDLKMNGKVFETVAVSYVVKDGIFLPATYELSKYNNAGDVRLSRKITVTLSEPNGAIPESFALKKFKPNNGDRLNDSVNGQKLVYLDGEFLQPKEFRSKMLYGSWLSWLPYIAGGIGAIVIAGALYGIRRKLDQNQLSN